MTLRLHSGPVPPTLCGRPGCSSQVLVSASLNHCSCGDLGREPADGTPLTLSLSSSLSLPLSLVISLPLPFLSPLCFSNANEKVIKTGYLHCPEAETSESSPVFGARIDPRESRAGGSRSCIPWMGESASGHMICY